MILKTRKIIIINWRNNKRLLKLFFIVSTFLFLTCICHAQDKNDYEINELKSLFETHEQDTPRYSQKYIKPKNESEFIMASGFNIYKALFSSQDIPSCVFYPSCSVYTVQVLQQKGLFLGTLQAFDRLSRCHRLIKPGQYFFNPAKQRFYDPIR